MQAGLREDLLKYLINFKIALVIFLILLLLLVGGRG